MQAKELYVLGFGSLHVVIFFRLLSLSEQILMVPTALTKRPLIIAFGVVLGLTFFLLMQNLGRLIALISLSEEISDRVARIATHLVTLLTLLLITTLLKNFILYR